MCGLQEIPNSFDGPESWAHPPPSGSDETVEDPEPLNECDTCLAEYTEISPEGVTDMVHTGCDDRIACKIKGKEHPQKNKAVLCLNRLAIPQMEWPVGHAGRSQEPALLGIEMQPDGIKSVFGVPKQALSLVSRGSQDDQVVRKGREEHLPSIR